MAGPAVSKALQTRSYEAFYRLAHDFSERLLPHLIGVKTTCDILDRLLAAGPIPRPLDDPAVAAEVREAVRAVAGLNVVRRTQDYFWPGQAHEQTNRRRWSPYDGDAWDALLGGLADDLRPALDECSAQAGRIERALTRPVANPTPVEATLQNFPLTLKKQISLARAELKPSRYEGVVADWLERRGDAG